MIKIISSSPYRKTKAFLKKLSSGDIFSDLNSYGILGVDALSSSTPVDTGLTASSWRYRVIKTSTRIGVEWYNTNEVDGTPVAILIQYGHGTGSGNFISGRDYINPAMRPVFDKISLDIWKKVKS